MRLRALVAALLAITSVLTEVMCMTNKEFFELVKDYAEDMEAFDVDDPVIKDDDDTDEGVIDLPGGPDDELDLDYLISKLDLANELQNMQDDLKAASEDDDDMSWLRGHRRHGLCRRCRLHGYCRCRKDSCECCFKHRIRINLWIKIYKFRTSVCVKVAYLLRDHGFSFSIFVNSYRVFHHEISVGHPPALCYRLPGLSLAVRACIGIYNVNVRCKSACLKVYAEIHLWFKKFQFPFKIGCFRIPIMDNKPELLKLLQDLETSLQATERGEVHEVSLSDLPKLYRKLQIEAGRKNGIEAEIGNDVGDRLTFVPEEENNF